ncbi:hypothetical protein DICPUDRAFT_151509 [Dictyostelium purpureum]|uniref:Uncharacterized protein n=1 Tax=Dictyostelium purpureum TaxID=5786 RepID=F0ZJ13_DICPU|nr:uncharacterized protein DICPUDRAFT_151509 [Dictyostelium purpureum]EGC36089.1 hypothetical protein DICPUDRAFT_151509 [Dictyostelium purpureum]|eukprot:XP_003287407.1 hypothetical protein DICPUDRAFT_151509 [Dictyostelium purpureum]
MNINEIAKQQISMHQQRITNLENYNKKLYNDCVDLYAYNQLLISENNFAKNDIAAYQEKTENLESNFNKYLQVRQEIIEKYCCSTKVIALENNKLREQINSQDKYCASLLKKCNERIPSSISGSLFSPSSWISLRWFRSSVENFGTGFITFENSCESEEVKRSKAIII